MISRINYRGLIKLVLHYRVNNSFSQTEGCAHNTVVTQITIQSNLPFIWFCINFRNRAKRFSKDFDTFHSNFYLPRVKWIMHWYESSPTARQMTNIYLRKFNRNVLFLSPAFYILHTRWRCQASLDTLNNNYNSHSCLSTFQQNVKLRSTSLVIWHFLWLE